jgi:hypothetical protein
LFRYAIESKLVRLFEQDLTGLQKADQLVAHLNRHGTVGKPRKTGHRVRSIARFLGKFALHFKTRGTNAIRTRHQFAKRIFVRRAAQRRLPMFDCSQCERHTGCRGERAHIIAINRGSSEFFDKLLVTKLHEWQS